jgi:hypothetical protein
MFLKRTRSAAGNVVDNLSGKTASDASERAGTLQAESALSAAQIQADSARDAAALQVQGGQDASALLNPFQNIGQQGLDQSNFLTDPSAQFEFLQSNPLFQNALASGDRNVERLMASAASRGRLSAGDTIEQVQALGQENLINAGRPLIQDQKQSIGDLLNFGSTTASNQGNLLTGQAAAAAGGIANAGQAMAAGQTNAAAANAAGLVGGANARGQGTQNILGLGLQGAALFSDPRLKQNINKIGNQNGFNIYSWDWNAIAKNIGLTGSCIGVLSNEVKKLMPKAVTMAENGYDQVDYNMIGVEV